MKNCSQVKREVQYKSYPTIKIMVKDLMEVWDLKEDKKMYHETWHYPLLEDCRKSCIEALWEKFIIQNEVNEMEEETKKTEEEVKETEENKEEASLEKVDKEIEEETTEKASVEKEEETTEEKNEETTEGKKDEGSEDGEKGTKE